MPIPKNTGEITCKKVAAQATEYIESRLPAQSTARVSRHLKACAACRAYVRQLTLVRDSLASLPGDEMPDQMRKTLKQRLVRVARGAGGS